MIEIDQAEGTGDRSMVVTLLIDSIEQKKELVDETFNDLKKVNHKIRLMQIEKAFLDDKMLQ